MKQLDRELVERIKMMYEQLFRSISKKSMAHRIHLSFDVHFQGGEVTIASDPPVEEQLRAQIKEMESRFGDYSPGHVYCYLCESVHCVHSIPANPTDVFAGYQLNGMPTWNHFSQALTDAGDIRIDRLYGESRQILTLFTRGRDLKQKMLHGFGRASKKYDILAQVSLGLLHFQQPAIAAQPDDFALTIQAIETRYQDGRFRLMLNIIPGIQLSGSFLDRLAESRYRRIYHALCVIIDRFSLIETRLVAVPKERFVSRKNDLLKKIPSIMMEFVRSIDYGNRQELRRTKHAVERASQNRPVTASTRDALTVPLERMLIDQKSDAVVLLGSKNRVHVFSREGTLITSFKLVPDMLDIRIKKHRWRYASSDEYSQFSETIRHLYGPVQS